MSVARSIAYLNAVEFGATLAQRADPSLAGRPLALLDDRGHVIAADVLAARAGIAPGQTEHQAVARAPGVTLRPADRYPILETQAELMARVARYAGRWQPAGLGSAYLDTEGIGGDMLSWCQALGGEVRGLGMVPSVGLAPTKFCAAVAGEVAGENIMLVMTAVTQRAFLTPQPIGLLPLEPDALLHLAHLGIRTLGQYACLPPAGVLARFGPPGRTAQRWVQGRDNRPVTLPGEMSQASAHLEFDGVVADREILLAALRREADALLHPLHSRLQAAGRLALAATRGDGRLVTASHVFPLPTAATRTVHLALEEAVDRIAWRGEGAADVTLTLGDITDAPVQQLSLLDITSPRATLAATLAQLAARFGPETFRMAALVDQGNPLPERRGSWREFGD